jgi:enoyl-CoA hydratase/carnithine racemase
MVVAGSSSDFGYSEINVGLIPAIHLVHLPRLVGRYRAFDLLFNGKNFGPQEAADLGIVHRVVPDAEVMTTVWDVASALAAKSPLAMRIGRAAFMEVNDRGYREKLATVIDAFVRLSDTEDAQEGLRAFAEKRPPQWQGL